jgi:hypothetical protein
MKASITSDAALWDAYNLLLLGPDLGRVRKMLVRYRLFEQVIDVPGDIAECGVFKGAGLMYWAKLLEIFSGNSTRRVIGFDAFRPFRDVPLRPEELTVAADHDRIISGVSKDDVAEAVEAAGLTGRVELVDGKIEDTAAEYAARNVGSRFSILHLDLDTYSGTMAALTALYPLVSPGGMVIFDEYGLAGMGETDAVDEFFAGTNVRAKAIPYSESPTAYLVKP